MRLFVSVDLPAVFADPVAVIQSEVAGASGLRLTDPEQAHVTLKFLGEVSEERLSDVRAAVGEAVDDAGVEPFLARFEGLGVFPNEECVRILWLGVDDGSAQLRRLHERIEAQTTELGFEPSDHEFTPHVTLGRLDHAGEKDLVQEVVAERDPTVGTTLVNEVRLTESELIEDGPRYSTVETYPL